jgi:hypothetical protein
MDDPEMSTLEPYIVQVHDNPTGAVGGERNHKTNNRVRTKQRVRLGKSNCQQQVAITLRGYGFVVQYEYDFEEEASTSGITPQYDCARNRS